MQKNHHRPQRQRGGKHAGTQKILLDRSVGRRAHGALFEVELRGIEFGLEAGNVGIDSLNGGFRLQQCAVGLGLGTLRGRFGRIVIAFDALELSLRDDAGLEQLFRAFEGVLGSVPVSQRGL